jgi:FtsP/CotA-like multicopper oxidase with cupredoxin domain
MISVAVKPARLLLVFVVAVWAAVVASNRPASAAVVSLNLCAVSGNATLTGAVSVPIWAFAVPATPGNCATATAALPSSQLTVNEGDSVSIAVTNTFATRTVTFEIPGITFAAGPADVAPGATVTFSFAATNAGTYQYQSAGDSGRQEAMGMAGALIVRPTTANQAYDDPTTQYDRESVLVLSEVDPHFNSAPDTFDMSTYLATYWLINGKAYPDTAPITANAGNRLLLRYVNVGYDNSAMMLLGMHERVVARSANLLNNPFSADVETIPAGGTEDAIATVPAGPAPSPNGFPLYNRQLHLSNGDQTQPDVTPATGGGMLTFIHP